MAACSRCGFEQNGTQTYCERCGMFLPALAVYNPGQSEYRVTPEIASRPNQTFFDSEYCYGTEIERHERGEARVIPIILRHVYWQGAPFGKLQALPTDGEPVVSRKWYRQDEAFFDVAEGICMEVESISKKEQERVRELIVEGETFRNKHLYDNFDAIPDLFI